MLRWNTYLYKRRLLTVNTLYFCANADSAAMAEISFGLNSLSQRRVRLTHVFVSQFA